MDCAAAQSRVPVAHGSGTTISYHVGSVIHYANEGISDDANPITIRTIVAVVIVVVALAFFDQLGHLSTQLDSIR